MSTMFKSAAFASVVFLLSGCPWFEVEIEIGEVCMTYADVRVEGVPGSTTGATTGQTFTLDDLSPIHDLLELDASLQFVRAELRATSGIADFGFVDAAHVTIASGDPESTVPTLAILDCDGDCLANGTTLEVPAAFQHEAVEYVQSESVVVGVDVVGVLPAESWTMDVDVCLRGKIRYAIE